MNWKERKENPFEIFSNLKLLCQSYPVYNYNTLNNYLSKNKIAYENNDVRIERKVVNVVAIPVRKMTMVGKKVKRLGHDEEAQNKAYWLSRPVGERLDAVTRLRAQVLRKGQLMDKSHAVKRKVKL